MYFPKISETSMDVCFSKTQEDAVAYPATVHHQTKDGYQQKEYGKIYVKKGSIASEKIERLFSGCGQIDFIKNDEADNYIICFRDKRVHISEYLLTSDFDASFIFE